MIVAAAPVVIHDTVRVIVHDTTVVNDTVTQVMGRVPEILDVRVHDTLGGKDWMTWLVQLAVALGAAFLGAWLGGKTAREAARDAIKDEWDRERRYDIERLQKRVKSNLRRVKLLSQRCAEHDARIALGPEVGEELEVVWNLYYRVAEPIFIIGADDLSERLDSFFVKTHTLAETVKALEARAREIRMEDLRAKEGPPGSLASWALSAERKTVLEEIAKLGAEATTLLREVRAINASAASEKLDARVP